MRDIAPHVAKIHVIRVEDGKMLTQRYMRAVPRVGDELRLTEATYYRVTLVVWCMDEDGHGVERVNVGVEPAGDSSR
jgi:hypothetical protein